MMNDECGKQDSAGGNGEKAKISIRANEFAPTEEPVFCLPCLITHA
jgi:hypothetical protein